METDLKQTNIEKESFEKLKDSIHQYSQGIDDIISARPPLLVRKGTVYFFIILTAIGFICWLIEYPQIVTAKGSLSSINAPKMIVARTEGKLTRIFVKESAMVNEGDVLAYIESIADPKSVTRLSAQIDSIDLLIKTNRTDEVLRYFPYGEGKQASKRLGELQSSYQTYIQAFIVFKDYLESGYFLRKRGMLQLDLRNIQMLHTVLHEQKNLLQQDLTLTDETYTASKKLAEENVIAPVDFRNEKSKLLAKQLTLPQVNAAILTNENQQNEKRKEIAELENQILVEKNRFSQVVETMRTQIQLWEYKYLIKAPVSGKVSFVGFFQENQEVRGSQPLFYVEPQNTSYYVEMVVSQYNFGKVKPGQVVLLKFIAYPFEQYGTVSGKIEYINSTPSDSGYLAKVILPSGLTTNQAQTLQYRNGLLAQADIVTENMRLLELFYYNLIKQFKRK